MELYKPLHERVPDSQYENQLIKIMLEGVRIADTPQGVGALTCFGTLPPLVFDVENGAPVNTRRKISFWRSCIGEIQAFANGIRTLDGLTEFGCRQFWEGEVTPEKSAVMGLPEGDLGPGSYGAAFHDFPMPDGNTFNQFAHVIEQLRKYPWVRTAVVTNNIPFFIGRGGNQKAITTPCHGLMHFRVIDEKLALHMHQRSADMPIGVISNMIQYFALLLMVAQVLGIKPWRYIHSFSDAHIYENQLDAVRTLLGREARPFPKLVLDPGVKDFFSFRPHHFELEEYDPHPSLKVPVAYGGK